MRNRRKRYEDRGSDGKTRRTVAIIDISAGYVSWRHFDWSDDTWEAYVETMRGRKDIETELRGSILLVFKKKKAEASE